MSRRDIGELFEYSEPPYRFVVKLVCFWSEPSVDLDLGPIRYWLWQVVSRNVPDYPPGSQFRVMARERAPSCCWHARKLDRRQVEAIRSLGMHFDHTTRKASIN